MNAIENPFLMVEPSFAASRESDFMDAERTQSKIQVARV